MEIGASTACYYPLETEKALIRIGELGFHKAEIFFNSQSELTGKIFNEIVAIKNHYDINICSTHPFLSFAESYLLFSEYKRRFDDWLDIYKQYFEAASKIGSKFFVFHGISQSSSITAEEYFDRFSVLIQAGKEFGLNVVQENVSKYLSQSPTFLLKMRDYIGEDFKMTFDIKQSVRAGYDVFDFSKKLADSIVHIHISDHTENEDCLPPGEGQFDFKGFFNQMSNLGYCGEYIIELYSRNYTHDSQILNAKNYLEQLNFA